MYLYAQNIHATSGFYANGSYSAYGAINVISDDVSTCYGDSSFRNITVQVLEVDLDRHWKEQQTSFSEIGGNVYGSAYHSVYYSIINNTCLE